ALEEKQNEEEGDATDDEMDEATRERVDLVTVCKEAQNLTLIVQQRLGELMKAVKKTITGNALNYDGAGGLLREIIRMLIHRNKSKIRNVRLVGLFANSSVSDRNVWVNLYKIWKRVAQIRVAWIPLPTALRMLYITFFIYKKILFVSSSANVEELSLQCSFSILDKSTFPLLSTHFPNVKVLNISSSLPIVSKLNLVVRYTTTSIAFDSSKWKAVESIIVDARNFYSLANAVHKDFTSLKSIRIEGCQTSGFLHSEQPVFFPSVQSVVIMYHLANEVISIAEEQKIFDGVKCDIQQLLIMMPNVQSLKIGSTNTLRYSETYLKCYQRMKSRSSEYILTGKNASGIAWKDVFGSRLYNQIEYLSIDIDGQLEEKEIEKEYYWSTAMRRRCQGDFH
ncbi:hypothetical protein RFI_40231, partial [Reticulomyxa filosa]